MKDENVTIYQALIMWKNYIETGDSTMSKDTALLTGNKDQIKILSTEQMKKVIELEDLANKYLMKKK